ncbi:MAG: DUF5996 family protein [Planctomycetota bacterium]
MNEPVQQPHDDPTSAWQSCGTIPADKLWDTRVQMHWALQIPAAVGKQLVEKAPMDSHTSLGWLEERRALATDWSASEPNVSAALQLATFRVLLDHDNGSDTYDLKGRSLADGYAWLQERIKAIGSMLPGELTGFDDMPPHAVRTSGAAFSPDPAALDEWQRFFENADRLLHKLCTAFDFASPVRTWPHHFDVATLIAFSATTDPATGKTIGIGFCPGDEAWYREPYWYCTPHGAEVDASNLPALRGGGEWRTDNGRPSAILRHAHIVAGGDAAAQAEQVQSFAESALVACKSLLGA